MASISYQNQTIYGIEHLLQSIKMDFCVFNDIIIALYRVWELDFFEFMHPNWDLIENKNDIYLILKREGFFPLDEEESYHMYFDMQDYINEEFDDCDCTASDCLWYIIDKHQASF